MTLIKYDCELTNKGEFGQRNRDTGNHARQDICFHKPRNYQNLRVNSRIYPSLAPSEGACPCKHLNLRLLASRAVRQ